MFFKNIILLSYDSCTILIPEFLKCMLQMP